MARQRSLQDPTTEAAQIIQEATLDALREENDALKEKLSRYSTLQAMHDRLVNIHPARFKITQEVEHEATLVALLSDWHTEEPVDPAKINYVNEYNVAICKQRLDRWLNGLFSYLDMFRSKSVIKKLVLAVLGDLISGYIHADLREANSLAPPPALAKAFGFLYGIIKTLLARGDFDEITMVCCHGNHSRTTDKPRIQMKAENSYEWLLYTILAFIFQDEPRLKWRISERYFVHQEIYGRTCRFHHGEVIKFNGGVGGITIALNKAIAKWNTTPPKPAFLDALAHWHYSMAQPDALVNGSVIGYSPISEEFKMPYQRPCQQLFVMHPKNGRIVTTEIYLDEGEQYTGQQAEPAIVVG